ncbi:MAG: hypothetical protein ACFFA1_04730 [Promethearchaeota archaeon]
MSSIRLKILMNVLRLTKDAGNTTLSEIEDTVNSSSEKILHILNSVESIVPIEIDENKLAIDSKGRLYLASEIVALGGDPENVAAFLRWQEFEEFCTEVLERNSFQCTKRLRFKQDSWWEIDVVGGKKPIILCIDAKHWSLRPGKSAAIRRLIDKHIDRVRAFAQVLPTLKTKLGFLEWKKATLIPGVVTLFQEAVELHQNVPVVPFFKFNQFIQELSVYSDQVLNLEGSI